VVETVGSDRLVCAGEPARLFPLIPPRVPLPDGASFDGRLDTGRLMAASYSVRPEITRAYIGREPPALGLERTRARGQPSRRRHYARSGLGGVDTPRVRSRCPRLPPLWRPPAHHRHRPRPARRAGHPPHPGRSLSTEPPGPAPPHPRPPPSPHPRLRSSLDAAPDPRRRLPGARSRTPLPAP